MHNLTFICLLGNDMNPMKIISVSLSPGLQSGCDPIIKVNVEVKEVINV